MDEGIDTEIEPLSYERWDRASYHIGQRAQRHASKKMFLVALLTLGASLTAPRLEHTLDQYVENSTPTKYHHVSLEGYGLVLLSVLGIYYVSGSLVRSGFHYHEKSRVFSSDTIPHSSRIRFK
jgi:hypothetical protein